VTISKDSVEERKRALRRALRMLAYRSRSCQEIAADLNGKGFCPEITMEVIHDLEEKGLVGDASLARDIVAAGQRCNKSRSRIYSDLRRRGIEREAAEESLDVYFDQEEECRAAARIMSRMLSSADSDSAGDDIEKAARKLSGRGFSGHAVAYALKDALARCSDPT
jgi:regulatory protein